MYGLGVLESFSDRETAAGELIEEFCECMFERRKMKHKEKGKFKACSEG